MSQILCTKVLPNEFNLNTIINNIPSNINLTLFHNESGVWIQSNPLSEAEYNLVSEKLGDVLYNPNPIRYGKVTADLLHLRSEANTDCNIVQSFYKGQRFRIVEDCGDWWKIDLPTEGYLYKEYTCTSQTPCIVSPELLSFTESWEGFSATPYLDAGGNWTIGYGICSYTEKPTQNITRLEAGRELKDTLNNIAGQIYEFTKEYNLCQSEFDSLVDFAYNLGVGALKGSDLLQNFIECNNNVIITDDFTAWSYCNGRKLVGLYRRRIAEAQMFLFNEYNNN